MESRKLVEHTRHHLFPTVVYTFQLEDPSFLNGYGDKLRHMRDVENIGNKFYNSWCSLDNLNELVDWQPVRDFILDVVTNVAKDMGIKFEELKMNCMWANIQKDGGVHPVHSHPNSFFSGALYLEVPEGDPGSFFVRDTNRVAYQTVVDYHPGFEQYDQQQFVPAVGRLIVFPSWSEHGTMESNFTDKTKERISVSFNISLKGQISTINTIRADSN